MAGCYVFAAQKPSPNQLKQQHAGYELVEHTRPVMLLDKFQLAQGMAEIAKVLLMNAIKSAMQQLLCVSGVPKHVMHRPEQWL